jgi:hypothetical protein
VKVFIGVVWLLLGFGFGTVLIGEMASALFGIPNMEGRAGMFGFLVGGPVGAISGLIVAMLLLQRFADDVRRQRFLALGGVAVLIGIPIAIWLFEMWRAYDHLTTRPNTYGLSYELRLPSGDRLPAGEKIGVELRSAKENPKCDIHEYPHGLRQSADRYVISGQCRIFYATPQRTILARIGDRPTLVFKVRVGARPESATFSEWFPVDEIHDRATGQTRRPRPDESYEIRYGAR